MTATGISSRGEGRALINRGTATAVATEMAETNASRTSDLSDDGHAILSNV